MIFFSDLNMGKKVKDEYTNPWLGSSIFDFNYFCCPECDEKSRTKQDFVFHASTYHAGVSIKFILEWWYLHD